MSFIILLLDWYEIHKRQLPWRNTKSPFKVWMSEIILQQTRIKQGLNYYLKFENQFTDIHKLANADEQTILKLWQGLGYYTRARNLHKTAKIISKDFNGEFPNNFKDLKKLPGIGNYTAAAISSICFDEKVPAIDGNAYRVYARLFGLDKDIAQSNAHKFFFDFAQNIMPERNSGDFNQAIMELGAMVCLPQNPNCSECPVSNQCIAYQTGSVNELPVNSKKIKIKNRYFHYFFIVHPQANYFLIRKRNFKDVWHNLFDFPMIETKTKTLESSDFDVLKFNKISKVKHILTHQYLHIQFYQVHCTVKEFEQFTTSEYLLLSPIEILNTPFPKPIADFLENQFG